MENIKKIVEAQHSQQSCVSIVLFDIDDFKRINDTYGHLRGNQVLCRLAVILQEKAGDKYIAARYGGEKIMLILSGCTRDMAMQFAEMIRLDVYHDAVLAELTCNQFSVSGGVTQYKRSMSIDDWIQQTDKNLYVAKENGKNRIKG